MTIAVRTQVRLLGLPGSLRRNSYSLAVLRGLQAALAPPVDLQIGDLRLPLYDQDEDGFSTPETVQAFRHAVEKSDAVVIVTPEYNHGIPGVLKNALDWASRPFASNVFRNKPVVVIGSSSGVFGAVWAQAELRKVLGTMGARVVDAEVAVGRAAEKLDAGGNLVDHEVRDQLREALAALHPETAQLFAAA